MKLPFFRKLSEKKEMSGEQQPEQAAEAVKEENELLEELQSQPIQVEFEKINLKDDKARLAYLDRLYEAIEEAKRQCGEVKFEYGQVTSYLKDIQLIDQAPEEEKSGILTAAAQIIELTEERKRLQRQTYKMTDAQKRALENYEYKVGEDIKKLRGYEDYQMKIRNDLRQLNSEKDLLYADQKSIIRRQNTLKSIGKCLTGILISIGAMLLALVFLFKVDITVPFIATAAFALVVLAIILNEARKNRIDMVITEKKCNRAIFLSNRVKIKHVNNTRTLDYMYHKYQVRNVAELDFVYGEYRKAKREWAKQRESTIRLNENNQILMHELGRLGVKDCEIWFAQAKALVEPKEMVEVRHDLNVRRQKLRDQMDYNTGIMEQCLEEMEKIRDESPDYAEEVERILSRGI